MPEERERDTEWRASESVEERKLHCSRRRQRDGDQREACYAQQREGHLQQEQQRVREWPKFNRGERAIYSRSSSV